MARICWGCARFTTIASRRWWETAFQGHPYGRPPRGTLESVPAITADDLKTFTRNIFARDALKVGIVGNIDAAAAGKLIDRVFGGLPAAGGLLPVAAASPQGLGQKIAIDLDVPQSVLMIGGAGIAGGTRWSFPDKYTGGDIQPVPLPDGNLLYSSYANTGKGTVVSVLGLQTSPGSAMVSLTTPAQDCGTPAVAADGVTIAMVCTNRGQIANIEVATLEGTTLSGAHVVVANCLCNSPSWSPSGDNLLYMNASDPDGNFGLWYIANAGSAHTGAAKRVTDAGVNLDATSSAAWMTR